MLNPILILIGTQILFTSSDLMGRYFMSKYGFTLSNFSSLWFLVYMLIRIPATFGQLYIFTQMNIGKTMSLFGAVSIVLVTVLAFLLFKETITSVQYIGITLAILAILTLTLVK
jgi:multidrug transporter EmrE-like cation transporter